MCTSRFTATTMVLCLLALSVSVAGCETNPYTGRKQLLMTSVGQEVQMGAQAYKQVKADPENATVARSS